MCNEEKTCENCEYGPDRRFITCAHCKYNPIKPYFINNSLYPILQDNWEKVEKKQSIYTSNINLFEEYVECKTCAEKDKEISDLKELLAKSELINWSLNNNMLNNQLKIRDNIIKEKDQRIAELEKGFCIFYKYNKSWDIHECQKHHIDFTFEDDPLYMKDIMKRNKELEQEIAHLKRRERTINDEALIEMIKRELTALGAYWRADWSQFDGRSLRDQFELLIKEIDAKNTEFKEFTEMLEEARWD